MIIFRYHTRLLLANIYYGFLFIFRHAALCNGSRFASKAWHFRASTIHQLRYWTTKWPKFFWMNVCFIFLGVPTSEMLLFYSECCWKYFVQQVVILDLISIWFWRISKWQTLLLPFFVIRGNNVKKRLSHLIFLIRNGINYNKAAFNSNFVCHNSLKRHAPGILITVTTFINRCVT